MKIILACVSLTLVACTCGQATSSKNYQRLFGIGGSGRRVRSGTGGVSKCVAGDFYIPAKSGGGAGSSNIQAWGVSANSVKNTGRGGGATSTFKLPGPISLPVGSSGPGSNGAPASSGGSGGNNFQAWGAAVDSVSIQDSHESASGYNLQVSSGGNSGNNIQGWGAGAGGKRTQGSSGGRNFQGWVPIVGSASNQAGNNAIVGFNSPTTSYGAPFVSGFTGGAIYQAYNGNTGESSFQGRNTRGSSLPGPIGAATGHSSPSTSYGSPFANGFTGGASYKGSNTGTGGGSWGSKAVFNQGGNRGGSNSLPGPIGNAGGASFQSYSRGSVSSSKKGSRGIGSRSIHENGLAGYQAIPVGFQTIEGQNVDPDLLEQIRSILLQEEASSGFGGGAVGFSSALSTPSSAYGVPSSGSGSGGSGRVIGITFEGIDQSIEIAQFHQTTSDSSSFGTSSETLAIPSSSYGAL